MDKVWEHQKYEAEIYSLWEKSGAFTPKVDKSKKPFCIIMPPPNASDPLHIGHAREVATQDALIRYHRMLGVPTLWLPGADHAGIETQYVYEKKLAKEGKSRFDFDRDTLYKNIWSYVQRNKLIMENQLRQLGASCDWTRNKFTLDPKIVKIVYKTFKKLYDDGFVYRGERIVNYCPRCGTAYSQLEVDYVERDDNLYYLNYGTVTIATTRPETIFADVAVAVNPKDDKYKKLIGKKAVLPLVNRELPIISDSLVDINFGTGALKITPGHDPADFEVGLRHKLPAVSVIDGEGKMINTPEKYIGMKVLTAREEVVRDLEKEGVVIKTERIHHLVGTCYRDKGLLEPTLSKQWFIKVDKLAKDSLSVINEKQIKFSAKKYEKIAKHWLKNLKDWNISRQIVWGIRIPAFRCERCLNWTITEGQVPKKCVSCGNAVFVQDPDTFDTWFSSGQWPFAALKTTNPGDFDYFYPTTVMNPAYDILPFWVIRMIMLGLFETGDVPFREVLLHGLVRDKYGVKISKSKGNAIDPIEMIQKYGADALRMASVWGALIENDNSLSEDNVRGQRNFSNKIWNISRFVLQYETKFPNLRLFSNGQVIKSSNADDRWILSELKITTRRVTRALEQFRLNVATEEIYDFVWHKFADKYIESVKPRVDKDNSDSKIVVRILYYVLDTSLRLLHPFMPFVTEKVWQTMFIKDKGELLINQAWPK
jgi:valyl-tRNA synthetase